ncbi:hypothetical protein [Limnohabitans sp. Hippo3]|uniref:hypothetical protein n=1 Tax=Limnohabitans sp. Hippo3 TaxID=1597956 RepID=UPI000D3A8241|nr:hypothetical protein [Limnohabitans sp. Hippo3]PUE43313.1 hypothetical protein B9Z34_00200 [Limnohabitans sp. Hippo3]
MKKNTVLRNESPHAVKMQAGSNVAERTTRKAASVKEPADKAKGDDSANTPPLTKVVSAPVKASPRTPPKPRTKARLKTSVQADSPGAPPALRSTETPQTAPTPPVLDEAALWEQDSPVKNRLAQLRSRNALLGEQLQRLKPPFQARGKKP